MRIHSLLTYCRNYPHWMRYGRVNCNVRKDSPVDLVPTDVLKSTVTWKASEWISQRRQHDWTYRATGVVWLQVKRSDDIDSDNTLHCATRRKSLNDLWRIRSRAIIGKCIQTEVTLQRHGCSNKNNNTELSDYTTVSRETLARSQGWDVPPYNHSCLPSYQLNNIAVNSACQNAQISMLSFKIFWNSVQDPILGGLPRLSSLMSSLKSLASRLHAPGCPGTFLHPASAVKIPSSTDV